MIGQTLSHYRITAALGAGGMGEVYRATDTTLKRDVAIKVLPSEVTQDPERLARFKREAHLLAALNHPNIAAIYGLEEAEGKPFLVLELVEGEDLQERLRRGAIPVDETIGIARQVAEGLEAAHEKGIVHRDLKPANIKLTPDGKIKVLDFGLAKPYAGHAASGSASAISQSPTVAHSGTQAGVILGTAAYMSPEQASGKEVDRRTDVWSFGVVLFEMITGRRLFTGESVAEILASILKDDPPWDALPPECPPALTRLLRRCLKKRRRERVHDIGDARLELEDLQAGTAEGFVRAEESRRPGSAEDERHPRQRWLWAVGGLLIGGLAASAIFMGLAGVPEAPPAVHFVYETPEGFTVSGWGDVPAVSPNGRHLAFTGTQDFTRQLWVRSLDAPGEARRLPETEGAHFAFWSPDSAWIAFFTDDDLSKIQLASGGVRRICARPPGVVVGGTWGQGGEIVFSTNGAGALFTVAAEGGNARQLTRHDPSRGEFGHHWPRFLPDGRRFLFNVRSTQEESGGLHVASLDAPDERRRLLPRTPRAAYAAGYLLFGREGTLLAQPFDVRDLEVSGEPAPVARNVPVWQDAPDLAWFGVSPGGVLVHHQGGLAEIQLVWLDRKGDRLATLGEPAAYNQIALSPDGSRAAMEVHGENAIDLWVMDVSRGVSSRVTSDPGHEQDFVWSPDGQELIYLGVPPPGPGPGGDLYRRGLGAGAPAEPLRDSRMHAYPESWSSDGATLVYIQGGAVWSLPLAGDGPPELVLKTDFSLDEAQLSPDGRWLAYISDESGDWEVYVEPFLRPGGKVRVSVNGGGQPKWRADGKELFYATPRNMLMAAGVRGEGDRLEVDLPAELFEIPIVQRPQVDDYAVSPDGQRFLVKTPVEASRTPRLHVVVNWPSLLE